MSNTTEIPNLAFKSAASTATIRFGSATASGRLISAHTESQMPKVESRGPDGEPVRQVYVNDSGDTIERGDLTKVIKVSKDTFVDVDAEAIKQAKATDLVPNVLELTAYNPKETVGKFVSDGKLYVFDTQTAKKNGQPNPLDPVNEQWTDFIYTVVEKGDVDLIGVGLMGRNSVAPYRLVIHQGCLALEKLSFPVELREFQKRTTDIPAALKKKAVQVAKDAIKPLEPSTFRYTELENMCALRDGEFDAEPVKDEKPKQAAAADLAAALEGFEA